MSRHEPGHVRLSNHVAHRANIWALHELGATAVIACTACGAVDPTLELGSLVVFDDLHFPSNRMPDGSPVHLLRRPRRPRARALDPARRALLGRGPDGAGGRGARSPGMWSATGGTYGHVDGPRFNTPSEIAALGGVRRDCRQPDRRPRDRALRRARAALRAGRLRHRLRQRGHARGDDAGGRADRTDRLKLRGVRRRVSGAPCRGSPPRHRRRWAPSTALRRVEPWPTPRSRPRSC